MEEPANEDMKQFEEWAKEEGLPRMDDPFMQKYFQGRDALIAQEKKQRSDHGFREMLSPMAKEACAIVSQIRFMEQQTIWTPEFEDSLAKEQGEVYPGMMFSLAKQRMEKTKLWQIIKKMPKGALLHCHLEAMVDLDWLIDLGLKTEGIHIQASEPLASATARSKLPFTFQYSKTATGSSSLWTDTYTPGTLVPLSQAAESFPEGGKDGFKRWFKSRTSITSEESLQHHHGPNSIWRKFISAFAILKTLIYYEPIYRQFLSHFFQQLVEDGVRYVDLRSAFMFEYRKEGSEEAEDGYEEMFRVLGDEIEKFQQTEAGKKFWGARMIWTTIRSFGTKDIIDSMKECIAVKQVYPDLIAGFDLVGQEDLGRSLGDLTPELFWFRKKCAEAGVEIPFFFHAGETLGDGDEVDENLFDSILLGTRRIGHGFSLYKHPLLMNMVKEKKILVESCPVSNEVLRLTSSIMSHPLPSLLAQGVPVALCNDDPAILGQDASGMTHDFWQALQAWENLGLEGLGSLAENSVRWAAFEDLPNRDWVQDVKDGTYGSGIRAKRLKEWKREWEIFCMEVVMEYGPDIELGDLDLQD